MYRGNAYRRGFRHCLVVGAAAIASLWGCSAGSGGGGGGGRGGGEADDTGRPTPDEQPDAPPSCDTDPVFAGGAVALPHYDLIPAPALPRRILKGQRPARVDVSAFVPTPCNQGQLNACVTWAGAYGLMTYLAAANLEGWTDLDRTDRHFSPTFVFNQANSFRSGRSEADSCFDAGCFHCDVFILLRDTGCVTWADMPYAVDDCWAQPSAMLVARAADYRVAHFRAVARDVDSIQAYLNQGIPVVAALHLGAGFAALGPGEVYRPGDAAEADFCHSVLVVGYDDELGAIKVMNSWGTRWADAGFGFVATDVWEDINIEAYVVGRNLAGAGADDVIAPNLARVGVNEVVGRNLASAGTDDPVGRNRPTAVVDKVGAPSLPNIRSDGLVKSNLASDGTGVTARGSAKPHPTAQAADAPACAISPLLDSDSDGYPDTMENEFASAGLDPNVPDDNPDFQPLADSDADGWPDETEHVFGTDPEAAGDFPFDCDYEFPAGFFDEAAPPSDAPGDAGSALTFRIIRVELPAAVTSDAGRNALTVFWAGEAVFPVTIVYRPAPGGCPAGVFCEEITAEFADEVNPLVLADAVWCTDLSTTVEFGYEVVLIDATGTETEPAAAAFTCLPP